MGLQLTVMSSIDRNANRHSHIAIRLQCRVDGRWERLEALGWNAVGFNFHHPLDLPGTEVEFKRGLTHFPGSIAWRKLNTSDEALSDALVNELIFKQAQRTVDAPELRARLLKLMRASSMVTQKLAVLGSLGVTVTPDALAGMLEQRKRERPMYHYGVRVQSPAWSRVVEEALSLSEVVVSLEKWSGALGAG